MRDDDFASFDADDIPRFAPNFSVYSQAANIVCLYSEDRKFLLHGELNCALAAAIAKGGKSFRQLVRSLERDFPPDDIRKALERLLDRRYILPASRSSDSVLDAYWASLGLAPEAAEKKLQKCRVRIQSFDVEGRDATRDRPNRDGRSRRQALSRSHGHFGQ